jgi:DNA-binding GntR family transcriptional regulator
VTVTAAQRATEELRSMILQQRLAPGQQLRQDLLAWELGLSRSPLREALRVLEAEGLVRYSPNQGYFVTRLDVDDLRQVYLMRGLLERALVGALTEVPVAALERLNAEVRDAASVPGLLAANRRFHFAIFEASGLDVVVQQLDRLWNLSEPYQAAYVAQPGVRERIVQEHEEMIEALRTGDLDRLAALSDAHRGASEASVLAVLPS